MKNMIYKNCIEQQDFDSAIQILNRKYSYYITEFPDYIKMYKDIIKVYKKSENEFDKSIAYGVLLFMAAFIIASISSSSNISKEWLWVYWSTVIAFQGYALDNIRFKVDKTENWRRNK